MKCVFCGGETTQTSTTFSYEGEDKYFIVEHVPAEVCERCGEIGGEWVRLLGHQERKICGDCRRVWDERENVQRLADERIDVDSYLWASINQTANPNANDVFPEITESLTAKHDHTARCRAAIKSFIGEHPHQAS
jgi:YgiT-type zinc finger domain-containing protein